MIPVVRTKTALARLVAAWRKKGLSVGFVPTMGALHPGHAALVKRSARENDRTIDIRLGQETYDAALPPKEFIRVPGAGHIQSLWVKGFQKYRSILFARMDAAAKSE